MASHCKGKHSCDMRHFLDTGDAKSTSRLHWHARACWGDKAVNAASKTKDLDGAHMALAKSGLKSNRSITVVFEHISKDVVSYLHRQFTYTETRCVVLPKQTDTRVTLAPHRIEIVQLVAKSKHPFAIVKDHGLMSLLKTGRSEYQLLSPATVSQDVKQVFINMRKRIAAKLKINLLYLWSNPCWTLSTDIRWFPKLCNRCMDFPQWPSVHCHDCAQWGQRDSWDPAAWYRRVCALAHRDQPCSDIWKSSGRLRY